MSDFYLDDLEDMNEDELLDYIQGCGDKIEIARDFGYPTEYYQKQITRAYHQLQVLEERYA